MKLHYIGVRYPRAPHRPIETLRPVGLTKLLRPGPSQREPAGS
jgi:hypothetical protein